MADEDGRKPDQTKALPGSAEERRNLIQKAIRDAGLLSGDVLVTDTFSDRVVVSVYAEGVVGTRYFEIAVTDTADGFTFGTPREVEKQYSETLVAAKEAGRPRNKVRVPFEVKSLTAASDEIGGWDFEGHFSIFDNEDLEGDVVRKGAFNDGLAVHLPKVCDHHGVTVGQATKANEDETGLFVAGRIYPTAAGSDLAKLMTPIQTDQGPHAPVEQGSIGYSILKSKKRPTKGLELTRLFAWEVSPVTFGANPATNVALKSLDDVHQMPTGELLAYAGEVARMAVDGADGVKALHRRRVSEDRDLTDEQWQAADELLLTAAEATLDLLTVKARAGRKATSAQMRHTRAIIDGLVDLVHGRPGEPAPTPEPEPVKDEDDEDTEAKAKVGDESAGSRSKDLRGREVELDILLADMGVPVTTSTEA